MQWAFYYTPAYTVVRSLIVNGTTPGAKVLVKCKGIGCPFASQTSLLANGQKCGQAGLRMCFKAGSFNITPPFARRHLAVGTRITISIVRSNWIGKSYQFTVRARRGPRIQIGCLAPGASALGVGC
jgi:hypothetical protein